MCRHGLETWLSGDFVVLGYRLDLILRVFSHLNESKSLWSPRIIILMPGMPKQPEVTPVLAIYCVEG